MRHPFAQLTDLFAEVLPLGVDLLAQVLALGVDLFAEVVHLDALGAHLGPADSGTTCRSPKAARPFLVAARGMLFYSE